MCPRDFPYLKRLGPEPVCGLSIHGPSVNTEAPAYDGGDELHPTAPYGLRPFFAYCISILPSLYRSITLTFQSRKCIHGQRDAVIREGRGEGGWFSPRPDSVTAIDRRRLICLPLFVHFIGSFSRRAFSCTTFTLGGPIRVVEALAALFIFSMRAAF